MITHIDQISKIITSLSSLAHAHGIEYIVKVSKSFGEIEVCVNPGNNSFWFDTEEELMVWALQECCVNAARSISWFRSHGYDNPYSKKEKQE